MSAAPNTLPVPKPQPAPPPALQPAPRQRSFKWLILLAVLIIGGIAAWRLSTPSKPAQPAAAAPVVRTATAVLGSLQRTARVAGQTSAIEFANITAPIMRGRESSSEMILLYVAPAGSWIKKGTLVAQIDAQSMQDHVDDLGDTIRAAESDIEKRKAEQRIEWENLQQTLRVAQANLDKARLDDKAAEVLTDIQQQLARLALEEAAAKYKQQTADLAQKKIAHGAELAILDLTLKRHLEHRDRHVRDIKAFTINASMDGLVVMQQIFRGSEFGQVQQGDRLGPGQGFMKIVNTSTMQVEGSVNQAESGDFRVGQRARIKLDAFPGLEFNGKVHSIGALAVGGHRQSQYLRTVPVRIAIEGSDPKLIPDLSASADVTLGSVEKAVIIPLSAISTEGGKTFVEVKTGETFERRPVETALENGTHVAIASGLTGGEIVRLN